MAWRRRRRGGVRADRALRASAVTGLLAVLATVLASFCSSAFAIGRPTVLPIRHPSTPGIRIACFEQGSRDYAGKVEPWHCEIAGKVTFAALLVGKSTKDVADGSFARFPVKGVFERIEWGGEWGNSKAYGEEAVSARTGSEVKLIAYRRVRCADGRVWYSRANLFNTDSGYDAIVQLPVCGEPSVDR